MDRHLILLLQTLHLDLIQISTIRKTQIMGWMWRCLVSCWACYSLLFIVIAEEQLELGDPEECKNADFVPGYNLGGEGFDVVNMQRKGSYVLDMEDWDIGNGTCKMYRNEYMKNAKQKIPVAVEFWRPLPKCSMKVTSQSYDSSEAVVKDSTSSISNNWKIGLDVPFVGSISIGGTHSCEARYSMTKSKEDKFTFTKHVVDCSFYSYKISSVHPLHQEFLKAVKSLPPKYNSQAYQGIIDRFGTHYTTGVKLGGKMKAVTAIRTCQASLSGLTETAVKDCLDVEASGTYKGATLRAEDHHCQELKKKMKTNETFSSVFSERQTEIVGGNINGEDILFSSKSHPNALKNWVESLKTIPDVVTYSLLPLHSLLNNNHPAKKGLKKAIETYISQNALKKVCSESCKIGHRNSARDQCACTCESSQNILSNCCPVERGLATLKVFNLYARGLYGDVCTKTDGVVQVTYGEKERRTEQINDNNNPHWRESFEFGTIKMSIARKLTFKVYDADSNWNSDLLGECSFELKSGNVTDTCYFEHGTFFFSYTVECAPSLQGPTCLEYKSSPMAAPLAKIYQSRNGILAKDIWKLGVSQDQSDTQYFKVISANRAEQNELK